MKIYTKTGDAGQTALLGGPRVSKDSLRVEVYGTVDELNSVLGLVRASDPPAAVERVLEGLQHRLFKLGAELATASGAKTSPDMQIERDDVKAIEADIDRLEEDLEPLREFILPGGTAVAAQIHIARNVCRRAERRLVTLAKQSDEEVRNVLIEYLNRLSDLLFVLARTANAAAGAADVAWRQDD
ncbi:MAG: cob(I)yrinic acid a,c-diamide adenosyltransferase [Planctomycetota bacterium]|nr:MAG: cob(I)yrinic acid a,c-diamide adenosyltransferase [Planctomycetota bacterium]REJ95776.1 MAG: cob(I)yrinic acid a,c-diamide adenosyltransferase [Planctomycetota bacterium]